MAQLVIVGGGFAAVRAALAADKVRRRRAGAAELAITLVSRDAWLTIRPRLYEGSLDDVRVPLERVLAPAGVSRLEGEVTHVDSSARTIAIDGAAGTRVLAYDGLVLAAGSQVVRPRVAGAERAFTVDTYREALALQRHLAALPASAVPDDARFTAVVVGAGFTGIETATELVARLRALAAAAGPHERSRVVLVDAAPHVAPDLGAGARRHVERALAELGVETRVGVAVSAIHDVGVTLSDGSTVGAATTVWTAGFRASSLTAQLPVERDEQGRLVVEESLAVRGVAGVYAAGDVAHAMADATHVAPMSCQYAIPMGERAGANAAAELVGGPVTPFVQPHYVTCLDLGQAGALFMQGWEREVRLTGFWAKVMKQTINTRLIYPPRTAPEPARRPELLAASTG